MGEIFILFGLLVVPMLVLVLFGILRLPKTIAQRAAAKDRDRAEELRLLRKLAGEPEPSKPTPIHERDPNWNRIAVAAAIVFILIMIAGAS